MAALQSYEADNGALPGGGGPTSTSYGGMKSPASSGFHAYVGALSQETMLYIEYNVTAYQVGFTSVDVYVDRTCSPAGSKTLGVNTGSAAVVVKLSSGNYYCASM